VPHLLLLQGTPVLPPHQPQCALPTAEPQCSCTCSGTRNNKAAPVRQKAGPVLQQPQCVLPAASKDALVPAAAPESTKQRRYGKHAGQVLQQPQCVLPAAVPRRSCTCSSVSACAQITLKALHCAKRGITQSCNPKGNSDRPAPATTCCYDDRIMVPLCLKVATTTLAPRYKLTPP
jgi:hypothetical protein